MWEMWRWEDVKIRRCEDLRMWRCEDVRMRRYEGEKVWRWEDVRMWRWEDVKMWGCEDVRVWKWEDVKKRRWEDEKMWRWEDVKMRRWEDAWQTPTIGRTLRSDALGKKSQASEAKIPGQRRWLQSLWGSGGLGQVESWPKILKMQLRLSCSIMFWLLELANIPNMLSNLLRSGDSFRWEWNF